LAERSLKPWGLARVTETTGGGGAVIVKAAFAPDTEAAGESFAADLHIVWHVTELAAKRAGFRHVALLLKATAITRPFGMEIGSLTVHDETIPNNDIVDPRFQSDTWRVRRESGGFQAASLGASFADISRICQLCGPFLSSGPESKIAPPRNRPHS
jgi:hypothetical protein